MSGRTFEDSQSGEGSAPSAERLPIIHWPIPSAKSAARFSSADGVGSISVPPRKISTPTPSPSPGNRNCRAEKVRKLLHRLGRQRTNLALVMERAYEGDETRQLALDPGYDPVVPPLKTRREPWGYNRETYKRRNEIEQLLRRFKGHRRIFSRFEKLDALFRGFVLFTLIYDAVR